MTWIAIKLFFGGIINRAIEALSALFRLALRYPWQCALIAALCLAGWQWRGKNEALAERDAKTAELAEWKGAFDTVHTAAINWRKAYQATSSALVKSRKEAHETDLRRIAADANALRLHGPGRATAPVCGRRDVAIVSIASGGSGQPDRPADDPLAPMSDSEPMAIVPWRDLTEWAEAADRYRAEALTWRGWYPEQAAAHEAAREGLVVPGVGFGNNGE